jgi:hypothetical protein
MNLLCGPDDSDPTGSGTDILRAIDSRWRRGRVDAAGDKLAVRQAKGSIYGALGLTFWERSTSILGASGRDPSSCGPAGSERANRSSGETHVDRTPASTEHASEGGRPDGRPGVVVARVGFESSNIAELQDIHDTFASTEHTRVDVSTRTPVDVGPSSEHPGMMRAGAPSTVEDALALALSRAAEAGRWDVVAQLAKELEARRNAAAGVVSLDARRERS